MSERLKEYVCSVCGQRFESEWSDEEAISEMHAMWPETLGALAVFADVMCDDCWHKMYPGEGDA